MLLLLLNVIYITFVIVVLTVGRYGGWLRARRTTDQSLRKNSIYRLNRSHRASYSVSAARQALAAAVLQPRMPSPKKFIVVSGNIGHAV